LGFLGKKEDKNERTGVKRKGRKTLLCPFVARNVVGETFLKGEEGNIQGETMLACPCPCVALALDTCFSYDA